MVPTAWMVAFFVSSMLVVVLLSFGHTQADGQPVFGTTPANFAALWDPVYLELFLRSLGYALADSTYADHVKRQQTRSLTKQTTECSITGKLKLHLRSCPLIFRVSEKRSKRWNAAALASCMSM